MVRHAFLPMFARASVKRQNHLPRTAQPRYVMRARAASSRQCAATARQKSRERFTYAAARGAREAGAISRRAQIA